MDVRLASSQEVKQGGLSNGHLDVRRLVALGVDGHTVDEGLHNGLDVLRLVVGDEGLGCRAVQGCGLQVGHEIRADLGLRCQLGERGPAGGVLGRLDVLGVPHVLIIEIWLDDGRPSSAHRASWPPPYAVQALLADVVPASVRGRCHELPSKRTCQS